jgi:hypothetical protein
VAGNHADYQPLNNQGQFAIKPRLTRFGLTFFVNKRQQGQDPRPLDRQRQIALLLGGESSDPARQDFATLSDKLPEQIDIFVVDRVARLDRGNATAKISHIFGFSVVWTEWDESRFRVLNRPQNYKIQFLLDLFMNRVGVAVATELFEF